MEPVGIVSGVLTITLDWNGLQTTWKLQSTDPQRLASLFPIPRTLKEALAAGWVEVKCVSPLDVTTWCLENDPRFCVLLDLNGFIAGFQAGVLVEDLQSMQQIYDLSKLNMYTIRKMFDKDTWTSRIYTVNPETIQTGGCSEWDGLTGTEGIWIETTDGYVKISKNIEVLDPIWLKQNCVLEMGTHYFYNMSTSMSCQEIRPWFLLTNNDELIGCGFVEFGKITLEKRDWYEDINTCGIEYTIPEHPQCLIDWATQYSGKSIHVFFIKESATLLC